MKRFDICALGELLIDFTENGVSNQGNPLLEANPGGAPCNVLSMISKQGKKAVFIGKVGNDIFGKQLKAAVEEVGVDTSGLVTDREVHTTLAFVKTLDGGDREFSFYRNPGADMMLTEKDVDESLIRDSEIFHFGSLSMTAPQCEAATKKAVACAENSGAVISFDPNLRPPLWKDLETAREKIAFGISKCDILKISDNEITWFTGNDNLEAAAETLRAEYPNIGLLLVSLGKDGSRAYSGNAYAEVGATPAKTIETTGAGDTFCGAILTKVLEHGFRTYSEDELRDMLTFANTAASIVTERKGALRVMPTADEIIMRMKENGK